MGLYDDAYTIGGAPLNLAAHSALLGARSWLASAVGNDALGIRALEQVKELGIHNEYISVLDDFPTGKCAITLGENGIPRYNILENVAYDQISLPSALNQDFDVIAFGTLALRTKQNRETLMRVLSNNSFGEVYADLNIRPPFLSKESIELCFSNATIVKISDEELPHITMLLFKKAVAYADAFHLIARSYPKVKLILITQGEMGSACYDCQRKEIYTCKAESVTAISTVGAGDSYGAAFLNWYLKTGDIMQSMTLASKISAFVVAHQEAIPESTKEFIKSILPT